MAYRGSAGTLEVAVRNGSAAQALGAEVGQTLAAEPHSH
ncbi:MAG: SAM hydroxide adenosyltransferase [Anaerolineae bacterium]